MPFKPIGVRFLRIEIDDSLETIQQNCADLEPRLQKEMIASAVRLGVIMVRHMRTELEDAWTTGTMGRSIEATVTPASKRVNLDVGPTVDYAKYVLHGTGPHWVPIEPLKRWAAIKLGDENAAYAVRWNIHLHGTSARCLEKYGEKGNRYDRRTLARGAVQDAIRKAAREMVEAGSSLIMRKR